MSAESKTCLLYTSNTVMEEAILASGCEMVTVAMKRIELDDKEDDMLKQMCIRDSVWTVPACFHSLRRAAVICM